MLMVVLYFPSVTVHKIAKIMKNIEFEFRGQTWNIPLSLVKLDYKMYLKECGDPIPDEIDDSTLQTWINEQISYWEIMEYGTVVKDLTDEQYIAIGKNTVKTRLRSIDSLSQVNWKLV